MISASLRGHCSTRKRTIPVNPLVPSRHGVGGEMSKNHPVSMRFRGATAAPFAVVLTSKTIRMTVCNEISFPGFAEVLDRHHNELCAALKQTYEEAGGPMSLPAFLALCQPVIALLLDRRVPWNWIGARVLAVYNVPDETPSPSLRKLSKKQVKYLVGTYSRQKKRTRPPEILPSPVFTGEALIPGPVASVVPPAMPPAIEAGGADPPTASAVRARIMESRNVKKQLGTLET